VASQRGKNKETNYRRYYWYHRYFKSKIPVYGPSLLTSHTARPYADNTIFWKLPDATHFRSPFYGPVHACRSAQRAINGTGIPLHHKYAKHAFYNTWTEVYRWLISYITPLSDGTPTNIGMYFIFLENKSPGLHFASDNIVYLR